MGKRCKVATRADRAFFRNNRVHTAVEHLAKQLDDIPTDSAEAERQHVRPEQHHCAHLGFGKWLANSAGVTTDKIQLKLPQFVVRHPNIGEFAEPGVDSVNHGVARNDLFDNFARSSDARTRQWRDCNMLATNCDCSDLLQSKRLTIQLHLRSLATIVEALKR